MAEVQQLLKTREYLAREPAEREQVLKIFQDSTPEVQEQILSQLTPASPAERAEAIAPSLQWLPGMEFMHVLPESAQRAVARYLPGATAAAIQTGTSLGGAALGTAIGGPVGGVAGEAGGSYLGRKLNVALELEDPGLVGDIASVALPPLTRWVTAAIPAAARLSRAGRAVTEAAEQTEAQTLATAAKNTRAQELSTARTQHAEQQAAERTAAREARYTREVGEAATAAETQTQRQAQAYEQQVQQYDTAVSQHETALRDLQAMPQRYRPETPSSTLYAAAAKANPQVELRQTAAMAEELMGTPEGLQTLNRSGVQSLAEELHDLAQQSMSRDGLAYARLQKIRSDLGAEVGRLRRQGGVEAAEVAKLYGALERDLASSPAQVLQAASRARRVEYAVEELDNLVQVGSTGIKRLGSGAYQIDPGALMTKVEKALNDTEKLFGGSFTPAERARIIGEFERYKGLMPIPRQPGDPPLPVTPKDVPVPEPVTPRRIMRPLPVDAPAQVEPRALLHPPSMGRMMGELGLGGMAAMYSGNLPAGVAIAGADTAEYVLSKMLLSPKGRPLLDTLMDASGTISPENMQIVMNAARALGITGGPSRERR